METVHSGHFIFSFGKTPGATVVREDRYDVRLIQSQPETLADFATSEPDKVHGPECAASKLCPSRSVFSIP